MIKYIFDVDGTLTPSRGRMDGEFAEWFEDFASRHEVYLITGSDRVKTQEQIPIDIYNLCKRVYQCSGNDVWVGNEQLRSNDMDLPSFVVARLEQELKASDFNVKTGQHFDFRPGLVNFSIVGRGATMDERAQYVTFDEKTGERRNLSIRLEAAYNEYNFQVAGETGIDITKVGNGKEQIVHDFGPHDKIEFFGDKMNPGGNDYDLALELAMSGQGIHSVEGWEDTWTKLKELLG